MPPAMAPTSKAQLQRKRAGKLGGAAKINQGSGGATRGSGHSHEKFKSFISLSTKPQRCTCIGLQGSVGAPVKFVGACLTIFGLADPMVKSVFCESFAVTFCMIIFLTLGGKRALRNVRQ